MSTLAFVERGVGSHANQSYRVDPAWLMPQILPFMASTKDTSTESVPDIGEAIGAALKELARPEQDSPRVATWQKPGNPANSFTTSELISNVTRVPSLSYAAQLVDRLRLLVRASAEEFPDQAPLRNESLRDFISLLQINPGLRYPGLVMTNTGNLRAVWRESSSRFFGVEFKGGRDIQFVVFAPDSKRPEKILRNSGDATLDTFARLVLAYGANPWVFDSASA